MAGVWHLRKLGCFHDCRCPVEVSACSSVSLNPSAYPSIKWAYILYPPGCLASLHHHVVQAACKSRCMHTQRGKEGLRLRMWVEIWGFVLLLSKRVFLPALPIPIVSTLGQRVSFPAYMCSTWHGKTSPGRARPELPEQKVKSYPQNSSREKFRKGEMKLSTGNQFVD